MARKKKEEIVMPEMAEMKQAAEDLFAYAENLLNVNVKKTHANAVIPVKAHATDAGMDLVATSKSYDDDGNVVYGTGLAFEIPTGHMGLIFPRSSNAKRSLLLSNCVGVIDSGYRGEVLAKFKKTYDKTAPFGPRYHECEKEYEIGDKVAQLIIVPYPEVKFTEVDELSESDRGKGGYGSTDKQ